MFGRTQTGIAAVLLAAAAGHAQCLQQWSGDIGIPGGIAGNAYAMTTWDPDGTGPKPPRLVVAGNFQSAAGVTAYKIAMWDGVTFLPFANGLGSNSAVEIYALCNWDADGAGPQPAQLIAAGHFAVNGNYIMRWDVASQSWQPLGTGMNNDINALTVWDPDGAGPFLPQLIAGGQFTVAGGVAAARIARWDGANWQPLLSGMNNWVLALDTYDADGAGPNPPVLLAGGAFTNAGGNAAARLATFDGLAWQPFGSGMNSTVWGLGYVDTGSGPQLHACGDFSTAGGVAAAGLARWNGTTWQAFGTGFNGSVRGFLGWDPDGPGASTPKLVTCGSFTTAGGSTIRGIAKWDGAVWSAFGTGVNANVYALANFDPDGTGPEYPQLAVGGDFTLAAGANASRLAVWASNPTPLVITHPAPRRACPGSNVSFSVRAAAGGFPTYQWRRNGVPLVNGVNVNGTTVLGATSITLQLTGVSAGDAGQYDVVVTNACGSGTSLPASLTYCYANCDCSTATPALTANDFQCFINKYAAGSSSANCDGSTGTPALTANDFQCFINAFAVGCP